MPLSTLRLKPRGVNRKTQGQDGVRFLLSCGALSSPTTCRFIPAHPYQDHKGAATLRTVEPFRLVHTGRRWYLVAWDQNRSAWRTFRVDRMAKLHKPGPLFAPREPPAKDLFAWVSRGWWSSAQHHARVKLHVSAEVATARIADYFGLIESIDENACWFDVGASSWEHVAMHLALTGFDFEVTEPPELIEQVRLLATRFQRATP